MLRIMTKKVSEHVDHKQHRGHEVERCSYDRMPKALRVCLLGPDRRDEFIDRYYNSNKLTGKFCQSNVLEKSCEGRLLAMLARLSGLLLRDSIASKQSS